MTESIAPKDDLIYRVPTTLQNPHFGDPGAFDQRRPWNQYVMGYPRFAAFISSDEDRSTTIYRRFERLSARNLLYLETELQELEETQDRLDASSRLDQNLASSMQSLEELNMLSKLGLDPQKKGLAAIPEIEARQPQSQGRQRIGDDRDYFLSESAQARLHVAARIRVVLREYYEFLKLESEILALNNPDKRTLKGVRKVFNNVLEEEAHAPMVSGAMETHLDEKNENDLHVANVLLLRKTNTGRCVLAPPVVRDRLTRLLEGRLAFLFRARTPDGVTEIISHRRVDTIVTIFSTTAAVIFLLGAVLGLYFIKSAPAQLATLSCLTVAFAGTLGLLTNAKRQDIFAATAAYAAVLVVFISSNLGSNDGSCSCPST